VNVSITSFHVKMEIKNKGVEFEVRHPSGEPRFGDCIVTRTGLTWCKGQTRPENGTKRTWKQFIDWMESPPESN